MAQLNPHVYRPNEFFASDLIFESLVAFEPVDEPGGARPQVVPALATSWTTAPALGGGVLMTFQLRSGVTFHDGLPWNAAAAVKTLDNVLAPPLATTDWHGWYDLPLRITGWRAAAPLTLEISLDAPYSAAVQDLTFIRPLRFLSPAAFPDARWPGTNSCPRGWGNVTGAGGTVARCSGVLAPIGTGPFRFASKVTDRRTIGPDTVSLPEGVLAAGENVLSVSFAAHAGYWRGAPAVAGVKCVVFNSTAAIAAAVRSGEIDIAYGVDTVDPAEFLAMRALNRSIVNTHVGGPINTRLLAINSAVGVTRSLAVRTAIVALVDRVRIVRDVMADLEQPATTVFPPDLPYCDVLVTPVPSFDPQKAALLLAADGWTPGAGGVLQKGGLPLSVDLVAVDTARVSAMARLIERDLAAAGFLVVLRLLAKDPYNAAVQAGNFSLVFTETWGAPYDPHTTAAAWRVPNEADYEAQRGMAGPMTKAQLDANVSAALLAAPALLPGLWAAILTGVHANAIYSPIASIANLAVVSTSLEGFRMGAQQFDLAVVLRSVRRLAPPAPPAAAPASNVPAIIASSVLVPAFVLLALFVAFLVRKERVGKPYFAPLMQNDGLPPVGRRQRDPAASAARAESLAPGA